MCEAFYEYRKKQTHKTHTNTTHRHTLTHTGKEPEGVQKRSSQTKHKIKTTTEIIVCYFFVTIH